MKRPPRMLRQVYTSNQSGDGALDAMRWGSPGAKRKTRRAIPKPKPPQAPDFIGDLCGWLETEDGEK